MSVQDGEVLESEHSAAGLAVVELLHLGVGVSEKTPQLVTSCSHHLRSSTGLIDSA